MPALLQVFGNHHPTLATSLAGILGVHFEDTSTGTLSLALADPHKLSPSRVSNAFIQASFATSPIGQILPGRFILFRFGLPAHIGRLEVLKAEDAIAHHQLACFFMVEIAALVANVVMDFADLLACFAPPL